MNNFIINPDDKFYPEADNWMWNYCTFLGKFTDSQGTNYDLGINISHWIDGTPDISDATVHSNIPGDYSSGNFRYINVEDREWKLEVYRRAKLLNLIK
jgi:hypothetical protein